RLADGIGDQQAAIGGDRKPDRAAPDMRGARLPRFNTETCREILIIAKRAAIFKWHPDDLVAGRHGGVPRSLERDEGIAPIFFRELRARIEGKAERGRMRLEEDIGQD